MATYEIPDADRQRLVDAVDPPTAALDAIEALAAMPDNAATFTITGWSDGPDSTPSADLVN